MQASRYQIGTKISITIKINESDSVSFRILSEYYIHIYHNRTSRRVVAEIRIIKIVESRSFPLLLGNKSYRLIKVTRRTRARAIFCANRRMRENAKQQRGRLRVRM